MCYAVGILCREVCLAISMISSECTDLSLDSSSSRCPVGDPGYPNPWLDKLPMGSALISAVSLGRRSLKDDGEVSTVKRREMFR